MITLTNTQLRAARAATKLRVDDVAAEAGVDRRVVFAMEGQSSGPSKLKRMKAETTLPMEFVSNPADEFGRKVMDYFGAPQVRGLDALNAVLAVYADLGVTFEEDDNRLEIIVDHNRLRRMWPEYEARAEVRREEEKAERERMKAEREAKKGRN